jgi:hypothetical protein
MEKKKYHTVGTVPTSYRKIDLPNTHMHYPLTSLAWYRHFNKNGGGYTSLMHPTLPS